METTLTNFFLRNKFYNISNWFSEGESAPLVESPFPAKPLHGKGMIEEIDARQTSYWITGKDTLGRRWTVARDAIKSVEGLHKTAYERGDPNRRTVVTVAGNSVDSEMPYEEFCEHWGIAYEGGLA